MTVDRILGSIVKIDLQLIASSRFDTGGLHRLAFNGISARCLPFSLEIRVICKIGLYLPLRNLSTRFVTSMDV